MFDLFSDILAGLYALWPSYGAMIILLTLAVRIVFTPLTVRGTKSMLEMRKIQPELKKLQAKHKGDRAALNEEVQALYRTHKINPLGGCLPLLAQAPVFLVMYQVLRGLTRRTSEVGKALGNVVSQIQTCPTGPGINCTVERVDFGERTFNPRYVDEGTQLFKALSSDTEMLWLGIDLSFSPSAALSESLVKALPYLVMVILVGVLGYYQQRQIAGRNTDVEVNPMQRTLMRVLPIFLPIISFSLPAGLIVYFVTTSAIGVGQQAFITRRVYKPWNEAEEKRKELAEIADSDEEADAPADDQGKPKGLLEGLFGPKQEDYSIHGRRRPSSAPPPRPKAKPPSAKETSASAAKAPQPKAGGRANNSSNSRANSSSNNKNPRQTGVSKRVTPSKKQIEEANRNKKKRRR